MDERRLRRIFFLLLAVPFLGVFPYVRALNNPNELVRVYTVMALVENGTYRVDEQVASFGHTEDLALVNGHYVMVKAPGAVHLGIAAYGLYSRVLAPALLGMRYPTPERLAALAEDDAERLRLRWTLGATWTLRILTSQLPSFLFLLFFERFLRRYSDDFVLRAGAVVAAGLGTNFLAYAHMFASHALYAAAAFLAFALTDAASRGRRTAWRAALVGFLAAGCVALEYQALFLTVVLGGYALVAFGRRHATALALGAAAQVPPVMWFQWCAYGNPFTPGHQLLENAKFAAEHRTGIFGISLPGWSALRALAFDPAFGLFALGPFLALGLAAIPLALAWPRRRGERRQTLAWALAMAAVLLVNAGFAEWRAGWTVGPRYLVVCGPFFAFGALGLLERVASVARPLARGLALGLAFAGVIAIGTVGLLVDTLPDTIGRPFAQFFVPMLRQGLVAHDIGEWVGLRAGAVWYLALAALLGLPLLGFVARRRAPSAAAFALAALLGLASPLRLDAAPLWSLHPSTAFFAREWEPR